MSTQKDMYQCQITNCGYVYNPDKGEEKTNTPPGISFKDLPNNWHSPFCSASKKSFRPLDGPGSVKVEGI